MELGDNFKLYPNIATAPWGSAMCSWEPFEETSYNGFEIRPLHPEEVQPAAQLWRKGFPELYRGTYSFVLDPQSYSLVFGEEWRMFVCVKDGRIAAAWLLRMDSLNLSVDFTLVVVHPEFRGQHLLSATSQALDRYVENCGAELATIACATFHTATRKVFRKLGFLPVGIIPGAVRACIGKDFYRRDSVELLSKLYGNAARLVQPPEPFAL